MRLMHSLLSEPIHFVENKIPVWIIENEIAYRQVVFDLMTQSEGEEGDVILSLRYEKLACKDHLLVISDYFHLEPTSRKLTSAFQLVLHQTVQDELQRESMALNEAITEYLHILSAAMELPTGFSSEDYLLPLLKAIRFLPNVEDGSPVERLIQYIELHTSLLKDQCIVLVNAKAYFSGQELKDLYKIALYQKWRILLLEPSLRGGRINEENCYITDSDFCELRIEKMEN